MAASLRKSAWPEARAALERAKGRVGGGGSARLRDRLRLGEHDLTLADRLEAICLRSAASLDGVFLFARSDREYEAAFAEFGGDGDDAEAVAARVAASDIRRALVDALDHWAIRTEDPRRQERPLRIAREAVKRQPDPDPTGWRDRARDPAVLRDDTAFARLIEDAPCAGESLALLLSLAQRIRDGQKDPTPFLRRIQRAHSGDFWANFALGRVLRHVREHHEALRYLQAALAIRPVANAQAHVGVALAELGRIDEAVEEFRLALAADPTPPVRKRLALALASRGPSAEADEACRRALADLPEDARLHAALGAVLAGTRRLDEAADRFRRAVELDPKLPEGHLGLRDVFDRQGRPEQSLNSWGKALEAGPSLDHTHHYGYAECCLYLGREEEYRRARKDLLARFGATADPQVAERVGRACLLRPASGDELRRAAALADRALAADPKKYGGVQPHFRFVKGLADHRQGRHEQAIEAMRGDASRVLGPAPRLVLAMTLHRAGRAAEARAALAEAVPAYDWRPSNARNQDGFICHALRREAEGLILPNLPAFFAGKHRPADNDERLALLGACQLLKRERAAAGLYADAFAAEPRLAEDFHAGRRASAARHAALAGCGRGEDAAGLGTAERSRWRAQALEWLRADLAAWAKAVGENPAAREAARQRLTQWRADPDFAGLREPAELGKLPVDEQADCLAFWGEVQGLSDRCGEAR